MNGTSGVREQRREGIERWCLLQSSEELLKTGMILFYLKFRALLRYNPLATPNLH